MMPRGVYPRAPASERFWVKVDRRGDDECWPWIASIDSWGYGWFKVWRRLQVQAHRFAYELLVGPIPVGCQSRPAPLHFSTGMEQRAGRYPSQGGQR